MWNDQKVNGSQRKLEHSHEQSSPILAIKSALNSFSELPRHVQVLTSLVMPSQTPSETVSSNPCSISYSRGAVRLNQLLGFDSSG